MSNQKTDYSDKRVIDFDPQICGHKDDGVVIFTPLSLMEGNNLFLPEKIRMPNGELVDKIIFEPSSFYLTLSTWEDGPITLYVGRNYVVNYIGWVIGILKDYERDNALYYPNVNFIILYDDVIEFDEYKDYLGGKAEMSSKNGILYCNGEVAFVPDCNPYAESLSLEPLHGIYKEDFCDLEDFCLEGYGKDLFGGIYSLDGKRFVRYDGMTRRLAYRIRDGVEEIFDKAFWVVTGLGNGDHGLPFRTIELPQSLKRIGKEAFRGGSLRKLDIPSSVLKIEEGTFMSCQMLESVILPENLQEIGDRAFDGSGIKSIVIPKSVVHIGVGCFDGSYRLSSIDVEDGNRCYSSDEGVLFNHDKSTLIRIPMNLYADSPDNANEREDKEQLHWEDHVCEDDGVVHFEDFYEGITYVNVVDPKTGKKYKEIIGKENVHLQPVVNLFHYILHPGSRVYVEEGEHVKAGTIICSYQEVKLQDGWREFYGYTRKRYAIPGTVRTLGVGSLKSCPVKELTIPQSVEYIGKEAFVWNHIDNIIVSPDNKFFETRGDGLIDKRENAVICRFGNRKGITIPDGVEIIKDSAYWSSEAPELIIPEGVKYIDDNAFFCLKTKKIVFPSTICYISPSAFSGLYDCSLQTYSDEFKISVPKGLKDKYAKIKFGYFDYWKRRIEEREDSADKEESNIDSLVSLAATSEEGQADIFVDEYGVKYSNAGKLLLSFGDNKELSIYHVKEGTEVICDNAESSYFEVLHLPASLKYAGKDSIRTTTLIVEGQETSFAPDSMVLDNECFVYIPCGTWARYRSALEMAKYQDEDEEDMDEWDREYNDYHLIELSKANAIQDLREQLLILTGIISQKQPLCNFSPRYLDGKEKKELTCFRTSRQSYYFSLGSRCLYRYALYLMALGYNWEKVTDILGVQIDQIKVNEVNETTFGKKLASHVKKGWIEEFVDEDTGDIVSIPRTEILIDAGDEITEDNIEYIKEAGVEQIYVYHDYSHSDYLDLIKLLIEPEEDEWKYLWPEFEKGRDAAYNAVMKMLFPFRNPKDITEEEKEELAFNLVTAIKGIIDHPGYAGDMILPFKMNHDDIHQEISDEEKKLCRLTDEFYNARIRELECCQSDAEVIHAFKDNAEIQRELVTYLKDNGVSSEMITVFVENLFTWLFHD